MTTNSKYNGHKYRTTRKKDAYRQLIFKYLKEGKSIAEISKTINLNRHDVRNVKEEWEKLEATAAGEIPYDDDWTVLSDDEIQNIELQFDQFRAHIMPLEMKSYNMHKTAVDNLMLVTFQILEKCNEYTQKANLADLERVATICSKISTILDNPKYSLFFKHMLEKTSVKQQLVDNNALLVEVIKDKSK